MQSNKECLRLQNYRIGFSMILHEIAKLLGVNTFSKDENMIDILGTKYITDKEAAVRYGRSQGWFRKRRMDNLAPKFVQLEGKGKVLYPMDETDIWFRDNMKSND